MNLNKPSIFIRKEAMKLKKQTKAVSTKVNQRTFLGTGFSVTFDKKRIVKKMSFKEDKRHLIIPLEPVRCQSNELS